MDYQDQQTTSGHDSSIIIEELRERLSKYSSQLKEYETKFANEKLQKELAQEEMRKCRESERQLQHEVERLKDHMVNQCRLQPQISEEPSRIETLEAENRDLKQQLQNINEITGVKESGDDPMVEHLVPVFHPPNQVVCEETTLSHDFMDDYWLMGDVDKKHDFYYTPHPPPILLPDHPWTNVKLAIRRYSKEDLKPVQMNFGKTMSQHQLQVVPDEDTVEMI